MASTRYEVIEAGPPKAPVISLIKISGDRSLTASLKAFGPNYFNANIEEMSKQYSHPKTGEIISLREPTTAESILVAAYDFSNKAKPEIFDLRWLQAGRIVRAPEWVVVNPPRDANGNPIMSYFDSNDIKYAIKVAMCNDPGCNNFNIVNIAAFPTTVGGLNSLAII